MMRSSKRRQRMVHLTSIRSSDILDNRGKNYSLSPFRRVFCLLHLTAPSKSWNRRSTGQQGNELPGIGAVSYEGLIPGNPGERPSLFNKPVYY